MIFLVSRTYSEVTPESAEFGDFSDTGFVFERQELSLRELIQYIRSEGFEREGRGTGWLDTGWDTIDYKTGTERNESLHITLKKGS